jgi:hypothetical protein
MDEHSSKGSTLKEINHRQDSRFHSTVDRRLFLQRTVMGALAVPLAPSLVNSRSSSQPAQVPAVEIVSGMLAEFTLSSIETLRRMGNSVILLCKQTWQFEKGERRQRQACRKVMKR